jgi:hypothetical protein
VRSGVLCGLLLGAQLLAAKSAEAEVTLVETDGWSFFTDGRINSFYSLAYGDDFPLPTFNPPIVDGNGVSVDQQQHQLVGLGQPFTAGFPSNQGLNGRINDSRVKSGFLGSVLAFGMKRQVSAETSVKGYIALWGTAQSYARDRQQDFGDKTSKSFDVREGWMTFEGPWGSLRAGRQSGILGGISTEIDFLYGHNYGLGLPCLDVYYPACGHIGTGALGPGNGAGFVYATPPVLGGLKLLVGLYDPVRLLGALKSERVPYPRPEGSLSFDRRLSPSVFLKLQVEGMYQYTSPRFGTGSSAVWGYAAGGRLEAGPLRLGLSAFHGKGLGVYVALQNAGSTFNGTTFNFRTFTGVYAQSALVFGRAQFSFGIGRVTDEQLPEDQADPNNSQLKSQSGVSAAFYYNLTDNVALGIDYFLFRADWWGAPNSVTDANGVVTLLPGYLTPEKQIVNFINVGATFHW